MWPFKKKQPQAVVETKKRTRFVNRPVYEEQEFEISVLPVVYTFVDGRTMTKLIKGYVHQYYDKYFPNLNSFEAPIVCDPIVQATELVRQIHGSISTIVNDENTLSYTGTVSSVFVDTGRMSKSKIKEIVITMITTKEEEY